MFTEALFLIVNHENNLSAYHKLSEERSCGMYTQWNSIQLSKNDEILLFVIAWVEL